MNCDCPECQPDTVGELLMSVILAELVALAYLAWRLWG